MTRPMNPRLKRIWTEALRSGAWTQGQRALANVTDPEQPKYCCLGVLCQLAVEEGILEAPETYREFQMNWEKEEYEHIELLRYDGERGVLPMAVRVWADLPGQNPRVKLPSSSGEKVSRSLTELNDKLKWDFGQIADIIEEQL